MTEMISYVELHCHSNLSLLDGAAHPEDLVARAAALDMPALALTDHDALYGAVRFAKAAREQGIKPIFGAELTLAGGQHLTLLVENAAGWANLCTLISLAQHNAPKGEANLPCEALREHNAGLIALSGCRQGAVAQALLHKDWSGTLAAARFLRDCFGPHNTWIELQHHLVNGDEALVEGLVGVARQLKLGYLVTNNVHYATRADSRLQDLLVCIRHGLRLDEAGSLLRPNSEFYLKNARRLRPLFARYPEALQAPLRLAERCRFEPVYGLQDLLPFPTPAGLSTEAYLQQLCESALPERYPDPPEGVRRRLAHELAIIGQLGLADYFLIVWDIVRFARESGILCQGRGSAAGSLVAFLLGISPIDPLAHDLVFERFLSTERGLAPDIDLDLQADRREEVIQYVYSRYGPQHAAMACTLVTFRRRSALRDVGQALGLSDEMLLQAKDILESSRDGEAGKGTLGQLLDLCRRLRGFPRHLGLHNGGMILSAAPLSRRLPTEPAAMAERVVVQWDKDSLEDAGLVKIDLLGLRMLSAIAETGRLIAETSGTPPPWDSLTFDDPAVYDLIARGDTLGVFQVESRAQAQVLPRLKPACFADLIVTISLIRPGPIQGQMVHPYLRRRLGLEPVTYLHPLLEPALTETLGVILFQEQVLKVARDLAGFTPGQGELLRRALGSKDASTQIGRLRNAFLSGAQARGVAPAVAELVWSRLKAFGGYSFPKSHAAAFAVLVYRSAWLKCYHPRPFYVALLNNQPMGFWSPAVLLGDARRHGIRILPLDITRSGADCAIEGAAIRLGFGYVSGLGGGGIERLLAEREKRSFTDLTDLCRRTCLPRQVVEKLILAGACDGWGERRGLLWALGRLRYREESLDLDLPDDGVVLPPLSHTEAMAAEQKVLGLSTGEQMMHLYRDWLVARGILGSRELAGQADGTRVRVAGLVVVHQAPPAAKGFHFLVLENEDGLIDVILRPTVHARYRRLLNRSSALIVSGTIQRQDGVVNLLAQHLITLPSLRLTE